MFGLAAACFFFYNAWSVPRREQLRVQEVVLMIENELPVLRQGLLNSQDAITWDEFNIIVRFAKDDRVAYLAYVNGAGDWRWYRDPRPIRSMCGPIEKIRFATDAPVRAMSKKDLTYRSAGYGILEVAYPIKEGQRLLGLLVLQIPSRDWREEL